MKRTIVIYHRSDFDGIFCREIAKKFLPHAELTGWDYGDPTPDVPEDAMLYILDLSVPDLMSHRNLIWIDHHKSAIEKYDPNILGIRIDGVAACRLAWQWFTWNRTDRPTKEEFINRTLKEPLAVRLAGEYDIWDRRDPRAELFQHGLRSQELSENMWDLLLVNAETDYNTAQDDIGTIAVEALLDRGEAVQYAKTKENESIIKHQSFTKDFKGLRFLVCNHARFNSLLFTAALLPEHDACLGFCFDGIKWKISMYHAPGKEYHDLSLIAVKYGGGGHKGACGSTCKELPFNLV